MCRGECDDPVPVTVPRIDLPGEPCTDAHLGVEDEKMLNDFSWKRPLPGIVETPAKSLSFHVRHYHSLGVEADETDESIQVSCAAARSIPVGGG